MEGSPRAARSGSMIAALTPQVLASVLLLYVALVAWTVGLDTAEIRNLNAIGLASVLPPLFWVSVVALNVGFALALVVEPKRSWLLALYLGALLVVLYATPTLLEHAPRTQSAWRLAGIVDYILTHKRVDRNIDAFFNWPGFFILQAFIARLLGLSSTLKLAAWAHLFFNVIYIFPLALIMRRLASTSTQVWIGLWLFFLTNWVGQDYLAPQALGFLIYLTIVGLLLTYFGREPSSRRPRDRDHVVAAQDRQEMRLSTRLGQPVLLASIILLFAAVVPSHQLTPLMTTLSVGALVAMRRATPTSLPIIMTTMAVSWVVFATGPYLAGHLSTVAGPVGSVSQNVDANLTQRVGGSHGHRDIVLIRVVLSAVVWLLAVLGAYTLRKARSDVVAAAILFATPFLSLGLQQYGGELLLRVFFFSLPFAALLAAGLFVGGRAGRQKIALVVVCSVLAVLFILARYGNEQMDYFTGGEVRAVQFLYMRAHAGDTVIVANGNLPWQYQHYADIRYVTLKQDEVNGPIRRVIRRLRGNQSSDAYLVLTRSQEAAGELLLGWRPGAVDDFRGRAARSPQLRRLFDNRDASIFQLARPNPPRRVFHEAAARRTPRSSRTPSLRFPSVSVPAATRTTLERLSACVTHAWAADRRLLVVSVLSGSSAERRAGSAPPFAYRIGASRGGVERELLGH